MGRDPFISSSQSRGEKARSLQFPKGSNRILSRRVSFLVVAQKQVHPEYEQVRESITNTMKFKPFLSLSENKLGGNIKPGQQNSLAQSSGGEVLCKKKKIEVLRTLQWN